MFIRYMSDIHLEFEHYRSDDSKGVGYFEVPVLPNDSETVLILAGDIGMISSQRTIVPFIDEMTARFKAVIYVLGNHEYYRSNFSNGAAILKTMLAHTTAHVLDNSSVVIDDVIFVGTTMWTDYNKGDEITMYQAQRCMNDYNLIKINHDDVTLRLSPHDVLKKYAQNKDFLINALSNVQTDLKKVVITHHLPSEKSVNEMFAGDANNYSYFSNLEDVIVEYQPNLWVHGHTHCSAEYNINDTKVVCNPRGYTPNDLNIEFDPCKIVVI